MFCEPQIHETPGTDSPDFQRMPRPGGFSARPDMDALVIRPADFRVLITTLICLVAFATS